MHTLLPLFHQSNHKVTIRNSHPEETGLMLTATDVHMPHIEAREWPGGIGKRIAQKVAVLVLPNLTVREHRRKRDAPKRRITFALAGPRELWFGELAWRSVSYTGSARVRYRNTRIPLPSHTPLTVRARPHYFNDIRRRNMQYATSIMTLEMIPRPEAEALSDDALLEIARGLADDLTLLVSFLSRGWAVWHRYTFHRSDCIETHNRRFRQPGRKKPSHSDGPIEWGKTNDFLRLALPALRKHREQQFDVTMAITYCIIGGRDIYADEKFKNWFTALEHLKDLYQRRTNTQTMLPEKEFKFIARAVREAIRLSVTPKRGKAATALVASMTEKVQELNRPAIRNTLDALFAKWRIEWRDLYPPGSNLTIVKTRNDLTHSSEAAETRGFVKEMYRVQAIAERLILRMLGWRDFIDCPPYHTQEWLCLPDKDVDR